MAKHYSSGIARGAARQFAGFPAERGKYYLTRSASPPPESLRRKVFPRLEESLAFLNSVPLEERDRAAGSVLNTLDWFRTVLLEDAAALKNQAQFRGSLLFTHPLFQDPEFLEYQRSAQLAAQGDRLPMAIQIHQLVPDIARELHTGREAVSGQLTYIRNSLTELVNAQTLHDQRLVAIEQFADKMNRGQIKVISQLQTDVNGGDAVFASNESIILSAPAPPSIPSPSSSTAPSRQMIVMNPSGSPHVQEPVPDYMVEISINTVDEAWEEWDKGLVNGPEGMRSPLIQYLDGRFGSRWRRGERPKQRYRRRKALIQRIKSAAAGLKLAL